MIPSITKILKIEAFKVLVMWDKEEVRVIDFAKSFDTWKKENNAMLFPLMNKEIFKHVSLSESGTLQWENGVERTRENRTSRTRPFGAL